MGHSTVRACRGRPHPATAHLDQLVERTVTLFSHSRLSSYESCPLQYRYRYIDKITTEIEGVEAFVGKRVHEVLERLYHHVRRYAQPPTLAQVQVRFRRDFEERWHPHVRIVRTENEAKFYLEHGARCLRNYYRTYYPFDQVETIAVELPVSLALDDGGQYKMRGILDRLVKVQPGHYEVHDYKTGAYVPSRAQLEKDRQLPLYQIAVEQKYEDAHEVDLVWHYLSANRTVRLRRSQEQLAKLREDTISRIDEVSSAAEFPPRPGPLCRWCDYQERCPAGGGKELPAIASEDATTAPSAIEPPLEAATGTAAGPRGQLSLF
jgi:putative RecB family exonuclease